MTIRVATQTQTRLATSGLLAGTLALTGCINVSTDFDGVRLSELDMSGEPPVEIVMAAPDNVIVNVGDSLDITAEGDSDALEDLRFNLEDDTLSIKRATNLSETTGKATIRITMPPIEELVLAGSGNVEAETLAKDAEVNIAGSGEVDIAMAELDDLEVVLAGSGSLTAKGTAKSLEATIAGSGDINFEAFKANTAEISIAGSGDMKLASDGTVSASIAGSGDVEVVGNATCETTSVVGSGSINCEPAAITADTPSAAQAEAALSE